MAAGSAATVTLLALLGSLGVVGQPTSASADEALVLAAGTVPTTTPAPGRLWPEVGTEPLVAAVEPQLLLPAESGQGRRVVFSEGRQRVWLVDGDDAVVRTYLVSGSIYDNLDPGSYEVYSRSRQAYGIDDSGTMRFFVRFTQGDNAAIGFHEIPVKDGERLQGVDELGTPTSHGCIRQRTPDARALWDFAPVGTSVVVTA